MWGWVERLGLQDRYLYSRTYIELNRAAALAK